MNSSHKEALLKCMADTLSPEADVRRGAEERLKALEVTESYGLHLMEIILEPAYIPPSRQLASVLLRQYVDTHWTALAEKFIPPEPTEQVKAALKAMAPNALLDPNSKIRNSVASVITSMAHWDWPENWPDLFAILMALLKDEKGVQGSMRVMIEVSKELTDQNVIQVAPLILPEMLRILNDRANFSVQTRTRAVEIFRAITIIITTMAEMDKSVITNLLEPCLEPFLKEFSAVLQEPNPQYTGYGLQKHVVKSISTLLRNCPKKLSPYLSFVLTPIWGILTSNVEEFRRYFSGENEDPDVDSDGEQSGIEGAIFAVFELVQSLLDTPSVNGLIKSGLMDLIYYIIFYMQVPQERVESWISSPQTFAVDEDEEAAAYTLRICAQDLLTVACDEFPEESYAALGQAVDRHLNGCTDWRLQEACLFAVSSLGSRVVRPVAKDQNAASNQQYFNIHGFIQNVVGPGLSSSDILLAGRCLVLGSNFCTVLTPDLTRTFVQKATEHVIQPDRTVISKILACRAINTFVDQSKDNLTVKMALLEFLPGAMDALINFAASQPVEILSSVLETIVGILSLDEGFTAAIGQKMTTLAIACFVKFNADPVICPTLEDIVRTLCQNKECVEALLQRFTPAIVSILNSEAEDIGGAQAVSLDLLTTMVRAAPVPLSPILMHDAFTAVVNRVFKSEDSTVLQNGGECLRAFTSVSPLQVFNYRDALGNSGLWHVVQMAVRLLDPSTSEFSASFVGRLVTTLIVKTGDQLGNQLELLLRAVLSKLQSADTLSVIQNLCMVYAHLINTQMEAALNFLDSVPGPTGQSALHFVMTEWVSRQQCFFGNYDRKVSCVALSKLLHHGISTEDPRLSLIQVKGEPIVDPNEQRMTRSQRPSSKEAWTNIPLLVKIFKLLVHELSSFTFEEVESGSSEGGEDDKENYGISGMGDDMVYEDNGISIDDQDVQADPIYVIDLEKYLKDYLKDFSTHVYYPKFLEHINPMEAKVLNLCEIPGLPPQN